jgi:hypothetical protein
MRTVLGNEKLFCVPDGSLVAHAEFVATFCAAAREYRAPVFTLHTRAKPMCFCPLTVIWLKCTFWHFSTRFGQANRVALPYCQVSFRPNLQYTGRPGGVSNSVDRPGGATTYQTDKGFSVWPWFCVPFDWNDDMS